MKLGIIGAKFGAAGLINGAQLGASILKRIVLNNCNTVDLGTITPMQYHDISDHTVELQLLHISNELANKIYTYRLQNLPILTIGGDHSIALGTIAGATKAAAKIKKNLGVIYIDAHTDINTPASSTTGNLHGMPVAFAMGLGNSHLSKVANITLNPHNLLYIGARSIDPPEAKLIQELNIPVYPSATINCDANLRSLFKCIQEFVSERNLDIIHLSIDIDVVDPSVAPGTGVPEPNGITAITFLNIIDHIIRNYDVTTVDFVEFNPLLDRNGITERICRDACKQIVNSITGKDFQSQSFFNMISL